jgi:hypothetical protein
MLGITVLPGSTINKARSISAAVELGLLSSTLTRPTNGQEEEERIKPHDGDRHYDGDRSKAVPSPQQRHQVGNVLQTELHEHPKASDIGRRKITQQPSCLPGK